MTPPYQKAGYGPAVVNFWNIFRCRAGYLLLYCYAISKLASCAKLLDEWLHELFDELKFQ